MKRLFKSWAGRHSPSPRKSRQSRRRHTSRRTEVRDHEQGAALPELVALTFLGYQHLPDGSFQPMYAAPQPAVHQVAPTTSTEYHHHDHTETSHDTLVDSQHFCFKCGKARSKRYHMENPIESGSKAPASCCTRCRRKNTNSKACLKYLQHFCADCGRVRSRSYHNEHPLRAGQKPRPSYCLKCRTRREEEARYEGDWEDLEADELKSFAGQPYVATNDGHIVPSDSEEDDESDGFVKPRYDRQVLKESAKLSVPDQCHRHVSKESVRSARSFQASVEEAPPTPPHTPPPIVQKKQAAEEKRNPEKKSGVPSVTQTTAAGMGTASDTALVAPHERDDCKNHVHVVYIHPPCYHHAHDDKDKTSQDAVKACSSRGRRADSSTTTTSSKQSRRVAFATPEVSSRHEADADYDRSAVPENHEDPFDFGLSAGGSRGNHYARGINTDGPRRRSPTPGPVSRGFDSSSGPSSSGYASTPDTGSSRPRMDAPSPPPEYSAPPPKVFSPDEIRRLWEQGPQPVHPRRQQRQAADSRNSGPAPVRDFSSLNRENFAANQRSASEGDYPRGYGDGFNGFRPSRSNQGTSRPANTGPSDYGRSDNRHASDGRYKNDENIDPKTRHNSSSSSRPGQSRSHRESSQQTSNVYNNNNNQANEYSNARASHSHGPRSPENNQNMYNNNQINNEYINTRPRQSHGRARPSEDNPNMYNNDTDAPRNRRSSQSGTASNQSENNREMYEHNQTTGHHETRPNGPSQPDEPWYQKYEPERDNSRQTSASALAQGAPAPEAPFTARERMWTDNPEHARKLREAMERLERAAAGNTGKTPKSPPTPEIRVNDSPIPESGTNHIPNGSTPDFGPTRPDFGSDQRGFSSGDFGGPAKPDSGSEKRGFTHDARNFSSADFGSTKPDFPSSTRSFSSADFASDTPHFSSDTRRDFSPNVPPDFVPPRPAGFASSPPPFNDYRTASAATWEHPCGPFCNDFCPDREDHIAREIVEVDSDEEKEILGVKTGRGNKKGSRETLRKASSDRAFRLALVRLRRHSVADGAPPSPAKSVGSTYYTASEASCS